MALLKLHHSPWSHHFDPLDFPCTPLLFYLICLSKRLAHIVILNLLFLHLSPLGKHDVVFMLHLQVILNEKLLLLSFNACLQFLFCIMVLNLF